MMGAVTFEYFDPTRHQALVQRPMEQALLYGTKDAREVYETYVKFALAGPAVVGLIDNKALGLGGIQEVWPLVGQAWAFLSPEAMDHFKEVHAAVRTFITIWQHEYGFRRIQAVVDAEFPGARLWVEHLGFQKEGTMQNYGPFAIGTFEMWALLREED